MFDPIDYCNSISGIERLTASDGISCSLSCSFSLLSFALTALLVLVCFMAVHERVKPYRDHRWMGLVFLFPIGVNTGTRYL